jgi:hypothetical protein
MAKLHLKTGDLAVFLLPLENDLNKSLVALELVPVLESAVRMPSKAGINQK